MNSVLNPLPMGPWDWRGTLCTFKVLIVVEAKVETSIPADPLVLPVSWSQKLAQEGRKMLVLRPLGFFLLFCTMSPCWFKNHILNWYRSILPTAWYQKVLLPQLLKITACWQCQETPVHVWQWADITRKELASGKVYIYQAQFHCLLALGIPKVSQLQAPNHLIGARQFCLLPRSPCSQPQLPLPVTRHWLGWL